LFSFLCCEPFHPASAGVFLSIVLFSLLPAKDDAALLQSQKDEERETGHHSLHASSLILPSLSCNVGQKEAPKPILSARLVGAPRSRSCILRRIQLFASERARGAEVFHCFLYPLFSEHSHPYINFVSFDCFQAPSARGNKDRFPPFSVG
jgi:hypothetical protein